MSDKQPTGNIDAKPNFDNNHEELNRRKAEKFSDLNTEAYKEGHSIAFELAAHALKKQNDENPINHTPKFIGPNGEVGIIHPLESGLVPTPSEEEIKYQQESIRLESKTTTDIANQRKQHLATVTKDRDKVKTTMNYEEFTLTDYQGTERHDLHIVTTLVDTKGNHESRLEIIREGDEVPWGTYQYLTTVLGEDKLETTFKFKTEPPVSKD